MPIVVEINVQTDERTEREMTPEELAAFAPPEDPAPAPVVE